MKAMYEFIYRESLLEKIYVSTHFIDQQKRHCHCWVCNDTHMHNPCLRTLSISGRGQQVRNGAIYYRRKFRVLFPIQETRGIVKRYIDM